MPGASEPTIAHADGRSRADRRWMAATAAATVIGALVIIAAERRRPLRPRTQREPDRTIRNLAMGIGCSLAIMVAETPFVEPLARRAETRRRGLTQRLRLPSWGRDVAAIVLMDYTFYVWHILTHKVPFLWRFHIVHHVDLDLDASTAVRFHALDMVISAPWRMAQVAFIGVSSRGLKLWRCFFTLSILFHHSNWRLPDRWERRLSWLFTTPRMHGIHHTAVRERTDSNWSSGLSLWDHLHGTFRADPDLGEIGVPAYRNAADVDLKPSLSMPFVRQRDDWKFPGDADAALYGTVRVAPFKPRAERPPRRAEAS